jgi:hypothetical protein
MAETEQITVAETSDGPGGTRAVGTKVELPVVEILTGRGFITGKSGSGKSNSASVVAEKLLDGGFGLLIVDIDGEYYGLKEEYEILHAGGDEECDIQVTPEHAEKLASLALEQNVPIILDMSSYLDEAEAQELLTAVSRSLFAKEKKQKQPFLMLVEEVHEYIPEKGSVGECGKMLIKIGKRGRKHGLGICGISQRPADVKKDFITQCDWLLWHRLTWNNDTKVVRRILDGEYADAVENLDDGEGFLMTDWAESVDRVQFYRKKTFDAGATPGLDDFERPDLKSVSDDLVSELEDITEDQQERETQITQLREELDKKNSQIAELETELQDARDLSRMAEQFVEALVHHVEGPAPGRTERERMRGEFSISGADMPAETDEETSASESETAASSNGTTDEAMADAMLGAVADGEGFGAVGQNGDSGEHESETADEEETDMSGWAGTDESADAAGTDETDTRETAHNGGQSMTETDNTGESDSEFSADEILATLSAVSEQRETGDRPGRTPTPREEVEATIRSDAEIVSGGGAATANAGASAIDGPRTKQEPLVVRELKADIAGMPTKTRKMLSFYREKGPATPLNAHFAAGGDGDRTQAYAHNRTLRTTGVIEHVGRGRYDYRLRDLLQEEIEGRLDDDTLDAYVETIESNVFD